MTSHTPEMHAVLERLDKLEKQNRRLTRLGVVALASIGQQEQTGDFGVTT